MVKRSKSSLAPDDREIAELFDSWDKLLEWLLNTAPSSMRMIQPALGHLLTFVRFFHANIGQDLDVSYLWGSLLVSQYLRELDQLPRMVKSLALKAESFNRHCVRTSIVTSSIKEVCFDIQYQFVDFFTITINEIRLAESRDYGVVVTNASSGPQQSIRRRYEEASLEVGEALSRLSKIDTASPFPVDPTTTGGVRSTPKQRCILMPPVKTNRIFDRLDVFLQLEELLAADAGDGSLQSIALHGLGGVGKTSIASSYAEKKYSQEAYDVVLWVHGEKDASLRQSYTDIALRLKLPGAQLLAHEENHLLVHDWFRTTECKWLVIFDNVESSNTLRPYWPRATNQGRAIITTRNHSLAYEPAQSGIEITSWDVNTGAEFLLFLLKKSIGRDLASESTSAHTLSEKLSGHALALSQMAGLIYDGELSIKEFTSMYLENPQPAHAVDGLSKLWQLSFESLDANSFSLLGIISFLQSDNIPMEIFKLRDGLELPSNLEFLDSQFKILAAISKLTTRALIKRDKDSGVLTVHRLIQAQFRYFLAPEQLQKAFNDTIILVSYVLPEIDMEKGQLYEGWESYNRYLQHVISLRDIFQEDSKASRGLKASTLFCEILNQYQRYLYEKCDFEECARTCQVNRAAVLTLSSDEDKIDLECTILSHQAQVIEIIDEIQRAIAICRQDISIRRKEKPQKKIYLAHSVGNLGIIHTSANEPEKALGYFLESRGWWASHYEDQNEDRVFGPCIQVYEARCRMDIGELDLAEEMLHDALAEEKKSKPPSFGTMANAYFFLGVLYRRRQQPESAEDLFIQAQNTWREGDQTRVHPFNAGILYNIGACCLDQGKVEASIKHIRESNEITEIYSRTMPVEHGRNLFKLSEALMQNGDEKEAEASVLRDEAESFLKKKRPDAIETGTENAYSDLIPIYWR
ncbi:unnamed protein product [Clonostachys chloroleuca]|uniref:NB-ARC domain-containing protein n=1 Tax=Clonostachys chloroleuca TaxID=1926264 RepID=A0AA35PY58_9HYPO|nr:unnamed protein product [Clonostachys chloroleuca]